MTSRNLITALFCSAAADVPSPAVTAVVADAVAVVTAVAVTAAGAEVAAGPDGGSRDILLSAPKSHHLLLWQQAE